MSSVQDSLDGTQIDDGVVRAADGTPLKARLAKALRREKLRSFLMIAPLLLFILLSFVVPIGDMLFRSVENQIVRNTIPLTVAALEDWDETSGEIPDESVFEAFHTDMIEAFKNKTHTRLGLRLNYDTPGMSGLFRKSGSRARRMEPPYQPAFIEVDEDWGSVETWATIKRASSSAMAPRWNWPS